MFAKLTIVQVNHSAAAISCIAILFSVRDQRVRSNWKLFEWRLKLWIGWISFKTTGLSAIFVERQRPPKPGGISFKCDLCWNTTFEDTHHVWLGAKRNERDMQLLFWHVQWLETGSRSEMPMTSPFPSLENIWLKLKSVPYPLNSSTSYIDTLPGFRAN